MVHLVVRDERGDGAHGLHTWRRGQVGVAQAGAEVCQQRHRLLVGGRSALVGRAQDGQQPGRDLRGKGT